MLASSHMSITGGRFSACNVAVSQGIRFSNRPASATPVLFVFPGQARRAQLLHFRSMATGEPKSQTGETRNEPSLADRIRVGSLSENGLTYKEKFIIRCHEVGINKTATIQTIANFLQEVASNHVQNLRYSTDGFSNTLKMQKLNLIWVIARMHIEVSKYPAWDHVVEIETWVQSEDRSGMRRDWIIKDYATDEIIGRSTSKWVIMNQDTRRVQRVTDDLRNEILIHCPKELRLAFPEENNDSLTKIAKLDDPPQYSKHELVPRRTDLDMNCHVNNVTYIGWFLESMPEEVISSYELETITLDYRRECLQGDVVDSLTSPESVIDDTFYELKGTNGFSINGKYEKSCLQFLHLVRLAKDGLEINRGRTKWRKNPT